MTFARFFSYFHLLVEENQKNTFFHSTIFFFCEIAQITYFYAFILILRQYIYFSLKPHKWPFFQCFFQRFITFKGKPSLLRKKIWFYTKIHFFNNFLLISMFWLKQENKYYIHFLSLKLYKVSIVILFGRLNTFCRKQLFHVTIYFFFWKK